MSNQVALVLTGEVTEVTKPFFNQMPVWIVQTNSNFDYIKALRHQPSPTTLITTFPRREGESIPDLAELIIYTLDDHHNEHSYGEVYDTLLVCGLALRETKKGGFS